MDLGLNNMTSKLYLFCFVLYIVNFHTLCMHICHKDSQLIGGDSTFYYNSFVNNSLNIRHTKKKKMFEPGWTF